MGTLELGYKNSPNFELVLVTRDSNGNPTGTKTCIADDANKISEFFLRNRGKPKKKNKKQTNKENVKLVKQHDNVQAYVDTSEREVVNDNK
jgi:hypothetical protein